MNLRFLLFILFFSSSFLLQAQVQHSGWLGSFNTFKVSDHFSIHFDAQFRSSNELKQIQTILIRPGINYHLNKHFTITAGYAYIPNRRIINAVTGYLPEHRIWEQILYAHKWNKGSISHRLRFEQRFLPVVGLRNNELKTEDFNEAFRMRYFIRNIVPFTHQPSFSKGWFFALQDEVFLNVGNKANVNGKTFDQNRLYGAFGYRFPFKIDIEAGYMNQYTTTRSSFINNHIAQIAVYKRL
jgi:hypothetical protein